MNITFPKCTVYDLQPKGLESGFWVEFVNDKAILFICSVLSNTKTHFLCSVTGPEDREGGCPLSPMCPHDNNIKECVRVHQPIIDEILLLLEL